MSTIPTSPKRLYSHLIAALGESKATARKMSRDEVAHVATLIRHALRLSKQEQHHNITFEVVADGGAVAKSYKYRAESDGVRATILNGEITWLRAGRLPSRSVSYGDNGRALLRVEAPTIAGFEAPRGWTTARNGGYATFTSKSIDAWDKWHAMDEVQQDRFRETRNLCSTDEESVIERLRLGSIR